MVENPPARRFDPALARLHVLQNNKAHAPQLLSSCPRACESKLPMPSCPRAQALQQEKPPQEARTPRLEKAGAQPKVKQIIKILKKS